MDGFVSYSHDDYEDLKGFRPHLVAIERAFEVVFWCDDRLTAGYVWKKEILDYIERAQIFIILTSASSIGSEYIFESEIPAIRRRYRTSKVLAIPVVLNRCYWQLQVGALEATPKRDGRLVPVSEWRPRHNGFDRARNQIADAIGKHFSVNPKEASWKKLK